MLVALTLAVAGLLSVAIITQLRGLRLGGTIVIPVLAVYTLKNFISLPIFLGSAGIAYTGLYLAKQHTLVYGRGELIVAILVGSALPSLAIIGLESPVTPGHFQEGAFLGTILPGLTAFNYHQLKPAYRKQDITVATTLFVTLLGAGVLLVNPSVARLVGGLTPPILFAPTADVAQLRNTVIHTKLYPVILDRVIVVALLLLGFLSTEIIRRQFGIRTGVVSFALLGIYALTSYWLIVLWVVLSALAFLTISFIQSSRLLYGRVLIGTAAAFSLIYALPFILFLPVIRGLSAFFVAILAGINAYNLHVTPHEERKIWVPLILLASVPMVLVTRWLAEPYPLGILQNLGILELGTASVVILLSLIAVKRHTVRKPGKDEVVSASILRGGGSQ